jgi:aminoglycoside phosphotransferase (APT) family kinase protein
MAICAAMPTARMHLDEVDIDASLAARLIEAQFPQWARSDLCLAPVCGSGTDNVMYRLGDDMVVRLPRIEHAAKKVDKEHEWLPKLAPLLPLAIPVPRAKGAPGQGYAWPWSVYGWLQGETATLDRLADQAEAAKTLAQFIRALQRVDTAGAPQPGVHNSWRGVSLAKRDSLTRAAIAELCDTFAADALTAAWESALCARAWDGPPVWIHGDLQSGNLLAQAGRLSGVIDFGCLGVGDPACDLMPAWNLFAAEGRSAFCAAMAVDHATWVRGRGWALSVALIALPYYSNTNPVLAGIARYTIEQALADHQDAGPTCPSISKTTERIANS